MKNCRELHSILSDNKYVILGDELINNMIVLIYKFINDNMASPRNTAVSIACFVTAHARLKLYDEMEKIERSSPRSILYFDTDSIIFIHKNGNYCPKMMIYF